MTWGIPGGLPLAADRGWGCRRRGGGRRRQAGATSVAGGEVSEESVDASNHRHLGGGADGCGDIDLVGGRASG